MQLETQSWRYRSVLRSCTCFAEHTSERLRCLRRRRTRLRHRVVRRPFFLSLWIITNHFAVSIFFLVMASFLTGLSIPLISFFLSVGMLTEWMDEMGNCRTNAMIKSLMVYAINRGIVTAYEILRICFPAELVLQNGRTDRIVGCTRLFR